MKKKPHQTGKNFWEEEYQEASYLALSNQPSSDLLEFIRWSDRQKDELDRVVDRPRVYDFGCGNGRNVHFLEEGAGGTGGGFDLSKQAILLAQKQARVAGNFIVHNLHHFPYPVESHTADLVLDMMSSHVLKTEERKQMRDEIDRILVPGGFLFYKTFLLDGDVNVKEMIRKKPGDEKNSYVHHHIGHVEYVLNEEQIIKEIETQGWMIHKISKSHKHLARGKRRTISLYVQKPYNW